MQSSLGSVLSVPELNVSDLPEVGMSVSGEEEEEEELSRLVARVEAKYFLYSLEGLATMEVIGDFELNLRKVKKLTEEVMVRMQINIEEKKKGKFANLWREKIVKMREKLITYMTEMRSKERKLTMEDEEVDFTMTEPSISSPCPPHHEAPQLPSKSTSNHQAPGHQTQDRQSQETQTGADL